jgi:polyhydroxyalkanoate synthesis repressor PhaR
MTDATIQIRRYPNRRFYDRSQRRYVTLGEIEDLVLEGRTIEVRDSRTGEDITRQILTQILLERHPDKMEFFPAAFLHALLRANDLATEFWRAYLRQAMIALDGLQRAVTPLGAPLPWFSTLFPGMPAGSPPHDPEVLARRLAALEGRIDRLEGAAEPALQEAPNGKDHGDLDHLEERVRGLEERYGG